MAHTARRLSLAVSSRPVLYWISVAILAGLTGLASQRIGSRAMPACATQTIPTRAESETILRGLAIPLGEPALPVRVGDRVDVVGLVENVAILSVTDNAAVVAVAPADVAAVVAAVRAHAATLALRPHDSSVTP